jgi:sugar O-acyltransferase (sialic acid O-acetyltransferase NeuD family)
VKTQIAIYGAGGFAREVAWLVEACNESVAGYQLVCFIDDNPNNHGVVLNGVPILALTDVVKRFPEASVVSGIGSPQVREKTTEKVVAAGLTFASIIHPRVERSRRVDIGAGTVICAGSILTTNIQLGRHVQINLDCTIGHDVIMADYATLAPGVHVSGWVHLAKRAYVGTGAVIINGTSDAPLTIGEDAVIGAAACVTRPVPAGATVVGVPAKAL